MGRRIIGLTGYAQTGKDTVAALLAKEGYRRLGFADKVRALAYAVDPWVPDGPNGGLVRLQELVDRIGWERAKVENAEVRRYLQQLGTHARLLLGENVWVTAALKDFWLSRSYVISDIRFPNEAEAIKERGGQVWRIVRPGVGPVNDHISETAMDDYTDVDFTVVNDGTLVDLQRRVEWGLARPPGISAQDAVRRADDTAVRYADVEVDPNDETGFYALDYDGDWASAQAAKAGRHFTGGPKRHDVV